MRFLTYNVHSCIGSDGKVSPERISNVIAEVNPDVACLQELDLGRTRTAACDQARTIADRLSMQFAFFPTMQAEAEQYGDAILSKHPILVRKAATFPPVPRPVPNERRGAIWAHIVVRDVAWQVIGTHFGLGRGERRLQANYLRKDWIGPALSDGPVVLGGDFNSRSTSSVHQLLSGKVMDVHRLLRIRHSPTFATKLPFICLDYIFVSSQVTVSTVSVVRSDAARVSSDHFPLYADVNIASSLP